MRRWIKSGCSGRICPVCGARRAQREGCRWRRGVALVLAITCGRCGTRWREVRLADEVVVKKVKEEGAIKEETRYETI